MTMRLPQEKQDATEHCAEAAFSRWLELFTVLSPLIGPRGVAALFKRSLFLAQTEHPCLTLLYTQTDPEGELVALRAMLRQQLPLVARNADDALLQHFIRILTQLIGEQLTERLIGLSHLTPSHDRPVEDQP